MAPSVLTLQRTSRLIPAVPVAVAGAVVEVKTDYADVQTSSGTTRGCAQLQVDPMGSDVSVVSVLTLIHSWSIYGQYMVNCWSIYGQYMVNGSRF